MALIALFTTVISSYAQDTSRDYGNYQYFDGSIFDGSGQEDPQFNDIRQGKNHLVIHVLFTRLFHLIWFFGCITKNINNKDFKSFSR